jgi:hypothetical protein
LIHLTQIDLYFEGGNNKITQDAISIIEQKFPSSMIII